MRWEEMSAPDIAALDRDTTIVLLPLGSVEQHGNHLPVGTDSMLASAVALAAAARLDAAAGVVLPSPWYGFSPHHMAFAGTVTLPAPLLIDLIEQVAESIVAHGFRRFLIVNGHGGNAGSIEVSAAMLGHRFKGRARIAAVTYFRLAREAIAERRRSGSGGMGHAGEFETAMMLHVRPDLVKSDRAVACYPDTGSSFLTTDLLGAPEAATYLDFHDLSPSGTFGDPSLADAEGGAAFFEAAVDALAGFLADFARWPVDRQG